MDTTDLHMVLVGNLLESVLISGKLWELDMDGSTHRGAEVGWARGDVTQMIGMGELGDFLDSGGGTGKTIKDCSDITTRLHGDYSEMILFIDPDEEGLIVVVEDSSARWPVTVQTASGKVLVSLSKLRRVR